MLNKKRSLYLLCLLAIMACAKIHIDCPTNGSTTVAVGGSTVGLQLLAMGATAGRVAGFMAPAPGPAPSTAASYVDYSYLPIFGGDSVSCNAAPAPVPAAQPTPIIITTNPPSISVVH